MNNTDAEGRFWDAIRNGFKKAAIALAVVAVGAAFIGLTGGAGALALAAGYSAAAGTALAFKTALVAGASSLLMLASDQRPKNNQAQNDQYRAVMRHLGYTKSDWQRNYVHRKIKPKHFNGGFNQLLEFALKILEETMRR